MVALVLLFQQLWLDLLAVRAIQLCSIASTELCELVLDYELNCLREADPIQNG